MDKIFYQTPKQNYGYNDYKLYFQRRKNGFSYIAKFDVIYGYSYDIC